MADTQQQLDENATMPFVEHLRELRLRLRNSIIALLGGSIIAFMYKERIALLMLDAYRRVWATMKVTNPAFAEPAMYFTSMTEPFWAFFTMSMWAGLFISSPLVFHQVWKFIAPGLYQNERRYGLGLSAFGHAVLDLGGAVRLRSAESCGTALACTADFGVRRQETVVYRMFAAVQPG